MGMRMYEVSWKPFGDRYFLVRAGSREAAAEKVKSFICREIAQARDYGIDEWTSGVAGYLDYAGNDIAEEIATYEATYERDGIVEICE